MTTESSALKVTSELDRIKQDLSLDQFDVNGAFSILTRLAMRLEEEDGSDQNAESKSTTY